MLWKILIVLLIFLHIYGSMTTATACIAEMISCTRQMASEMAATTNRTLLCGILEKFMNCIEYACTDSLSQCDLNKARSMFADLLTDYRFRCVMYMPSDGDDCTLPVPPSSAASTLLCTSSFVYVCFVLNFT